MSGLPEPVKVSPIIKTFRYAFLVAGIFYGISKHTAYKIREGYVRAEKEKRKGEKEAQLAAEKQAAANRDLEEIVKIFSPNAKIIHGVSHEHPAEPKKQCKLKQKPPEEKVSYEHAPPATDSQVKKDSSAKVQDEMIPGPIDVNVKGVDDVQHEPQHPVELPEIESHVATPDVETASPEPVPPAAESKGGSDGYYVETFPDGIMLVEPEQRSSHIPPREGADDE